MVLTNITKSNLAKQPRDNFKESSAKKYGFSLYRIKLNSSKEIPKVLELNKQIFESIFDGKEL